MIELNSNTYGNNYTSSKESLPDAEDTKVTLMILKLKEKLMHIKISTSMN